MLLWLCHRPQAGRGSDVSMPEAVRQTVVRHMTHQAPEITFSNGNHAKFSCQHGHDPQGLLFQEKTRSGSRETYRRQASRYCARRAGVPCQQRLYAGERRGVAVAVGETSSCTATRWFRPCPGGSRPAIDGRGGRSRPGRRAPGQCWPERRSLPAAPPRPTRRARTRSGPSRRRPSSRARPPRRTAGA